MSPVRTIVIGGSAGGVEALQEIVSGLPASFQGALLIVLHMWPAAKSHMPEILCRAGCLPTEHAHDGQRILPGHIYTAVPDHHLLVEDGVMRVMRGPQENRHRPSIDALFRSAARACRKKAVGVLLTGGDDDGAAGLLEIQRLGGTTVIQDPADALFPEMPMSGLRYVKPDRKLPIQEIAPFLATVVNGAQRPAKEPAMSESEEGSTPEQQAQEKNGEKSGTPSGFTCPDCGGALWEFRDGNLFRYRCRIGHLYSQGTMLQAESDMVERALWSAVRMLEESAAVNRRIATQLGAFEENYIKRATERERAATVIRGLLTSPEHHPD